MYGICGWEGEIADQRESARLLGAMMADCGASTAADGPGARVGGIQIACHHAYIDS